ncbi:hypothetical protein [Natranaerobius thermophilus]|uniref:Uncharacterized protein n=1 Tax=Natranaerobius thermophilus (strain ATCC BAA-1301 / DSM 18059 / JW/NM-WN-LF) TaxID=457570 RepID=B2A2G2_NATTJ|nr:hypothetical protein [Natranaerobius thermophilus]ACB84877.1 hypothetical protein Nther_1294 [Natranaerobius thermophilus JW/NM-WN-LF]
MDQKLSLIEFLCLTCGFQGLGEKKAENSDCPKCQGKLISSEQMNQVKKLLV